MCPCAIRFISTTRSGEPHNALHSSSYNHTKIVDDDMSKFYACTQGSDTATRYTTYYVVKDLQADYVSVPSLDIIISNTTL